jgi:uncharacterized protein YecT (DUF1311 family)
MSIFDKDINKQYKEIMKSIEEKNGPVAKAIASNFKPKSINA